MRSKTQFPDVVASEPEVLAHHFTAAGLTERGVFYWQRAGQQASDRSAYLEGTKHFNTGIELLKTLPDTPARAEQELALHMALGAALIVIRGHASAEVEQAYLKAHELCQRIGATAELIPVLFGLWRCYISRPQLRKALELGESLHAPGTQGATTRRSGLSPITPSAFPGTSWASCAEARRPLEDGIARYAPQMRQAPLFRIAQDPGVACRSYAARCLWLLGFPDQALTRGRDGLALALELKHPFSVAFARCWLAYVAQFRRDVATVREQADAAVVLATEQGFPIWVAMATALRGWALAIEGKSEEGLVQLQKGIAAWQAVGAGVWRPSYCTMLAEAFDLPGQARRRPANARRSAIRLRRRRRSAGGKRKSVVSEASCYSSNRSGVAGGG